ncbi:MAG: ABC transporter ATP-binding protein [Anaerolineae bacterium]|nr:MAG: ABC transporter ATP-binding protein [Anaerolineae bacterium]
MERLLTSQRNVYRRLLSYLKPYSRQTFVGYVSMIIGTGLNLLIPQIIKFAIDLGLASGEASALIGAGLILLLIGFFKAITGYGQRYYGEWLTHRVAYDLRNQFFDSTQRLSFSFHNQTQTGDLMSRATSDIAETERFIGIGLMDLVGTNLLLLGVVIAMLLENPPLAILALVPIPVLIFMTIRFGRIVRPMFKGIQEQMGVLSTTMQESLTGIRVVKAFAREGHELWKFDAGNKQWFSRRYRLIRLWANNWPFFTFTLAISIFILLWFGGPLTMEGAITVGSLFAMISYVLMLNGPVQRLGFLVNLAATAGASVSRIFEIMDTPREIVEKPTARWVSPIEGRIVFDKVYFSYDEGRQILSDISFLVEPGQTIALMGPTGSGKSTLTSLIPRFYDPNSGSVMIDGLDTRDWKIEHLRRSIGIVMQDSFLFSDTIAENIAYGRPDANDRDIKEAARVARAHEFIMNFPQGYKTRVGERGVTLSGGQKQRIAIARALLTDPQILILDDSTSSVDTETEYLIQQALNALMMGRTTFVIAQRLLTLKGADCILVMDYGRIVQKGTHDELLVEGGLYQQIYDLQLKDQEDFARLARDSS